MVEITGGGGSIVVARKGFEGGRSTVHSPMSSID